MTDFRFRPLTLELLDAYRPFWDSCPVHSSDASLGVLWGWGALCGYEIGFDVPEPRETGPSPGLAWIRQARPVPALLPPIGPWEGIDWEGALGRLDRALRADPGPLALGGECPEILSLVALPARLAEIWTPLLGDRFAFEPCRDSDEYLHRVSELATLKGNRFMRQRNKARRFAREHAYEYLSLTPEGLSEIRAFQEEWAARRNGNEEERERVAGAASPDAEEERAEVDLLTENEAVLRMLDAFVPLGLLGGAIRTSFGRIVAYTLAEVADPRTLMIHAEKADPDYGGAFQTICRDFLAREGQGYEVVNREEDLGLAGLRAAKEAYHPFDFLRKGCARLRIRR